MLCVNGKMYAIVNRFGYYGITYNHNKFSESDVSSYDVLFDSANKGRVALLIGSYLTWVVCLNIMEIKIHMT